jgi:hypothetical protein
VIVCAKIITPLTVGVGVVMRLCFRWVVRAWFTPFLFLFKTAPVRSTKGVGGCITCINSNTLYFFVPPWWAWLGAILLGQKTRYYGTEDPLLWDRKPAFLYLFGTENPLRLHKFPFFLGANYPTFFCFDRQYK